MKLQPAAQKELARITVGTVICTAIMLAVFALLGVAGVVAFGAPVVAGALVGTLVAILNFALLCYTVQFVAAQDGGKTGRGWMQLSYNGRLLLQAVWCIVAYLLPSFQVVAAVLPLLFPRVVIFYLQITGRYRKEASTAATPVAEQAPPPEQER